MLPPALRGGPLFPRNRPALVNTLATGRQSFADIMVVDSDLAAAKDSPYARTDVSCPVLHSAERCADRLDLGPDAQPRNRACPLVQVHDALLRQGLVFA